MESKELFKSTPNVVETAGKTEQFSVLERDPSGRESFPRIVSEGGDSKVLNALTEVYDLNFDDLSFPYQMEKARKISSALNDPEVQAGLLGIFEETKNLRAKKRAMKERIGL